MGWGWVGYSLGESMFSAVRDASKVALASLVHNAGSLSLELIDCQVRSGHLLSLGAEEIAREAFMTHLRRLIDRKSTR